MVVVHDLTTPKRRRFLMLQTWLITGSARGLGRAVAEAALAAGHQLVATARRPEQLADLTDRYGERVHTVALDVTDRAQADAAVQATVAAFGRLDVLVNNAGYGNLAPIEEIAEDDFRAQVETNLWGTINMTRAALPIMRRQRSGHVIQISSVGGRVTTAGLGPYQTSKWAIEGFSGVLAKEVAPLGIKVTAIEPGGFRTDWAGSSMAVASISEDYRSSVAMVATHLRDRVGHEPGDPDKAAQVILQVAELDDPPLQLILGTDAFEIARRADEQRIASDDAWKHLSLATDFDDARAEVIS
jgi:NAD(P)-dependent dehydrogenase (short-subunit alcohol dehydrogenase family)